MWRQPVRELASVCVGAFLTLFALSFIWPVWAEVADVSVLSRLWVSLMMLVVNPLSVIPGLVGLGLMVYGPVSWSRRKRMERVASGEEDVSEPIPDYARDHGFARSHMTGLIGAGFLSVVLGALGYVMIAASSGMMSVLVVGIMSSVIAGLIALAPLKWWREWSVREAMLGEREEWEVAGATERSGVRFDFEGDAEASRPREHVEEVTRAR